MEKPNNKPFQLEDLEKKNIFSVPEDYFETLPSIIQARAVKPRRESPLWLSWQSWAVALASVALLLVGGWFFTQEQPPTTAGGLATVSNQEIIEYLKESDLTQSELIERVSNAGIKVDQPLLQQQDISDDALLEHLDTQDVEDLI